MVLRVGCPSQSGRWQALDRWSDPSVSILSLVGTTEPKSAFTNGADAGAQSSSCPLGQILFSFAK